jgi:hypothetical protein
MTMLEGLKWRPLSGIGQAVSSLLGAKLEGKKKEEGPGGVIW